MNNLEEIKEFLKKEGIGVRRVKIEKTELGAVLSLQTVPHPEVNKNTPPGKALFGFSVFGLPNEEGSYKHHIDNLIKTWKETKNHPFKK